MNSVILSGFISKDFKPNETNKMGNSSIAVKRPYPFSKKDANGNEVPDYINLRFIGEKNVIRAAKWLVKGAAVTIEGVICRDTWKTTEGKWGENNYILVKSWEFQTGKRDHKESDSERDFLPEQTNYIPPKAPDDEDFISIPDDVDDDLPFRK